MIKSRNPAWMGLFGLFATTLLLGILWWANPRKPSAEKEITSATITKTAAQRTGVAGSPDIMSRLRPGGLPEIDLRQKKSPAPKSGAERETAVASLRQKIPGVQIDFDAVTGAPANITAVGTFLSKPDDAGAAKTDPLNAVRDFIDANAALFGHTSVAIAKGNARVTRDDVTAHSGMRTLVWNQELDGIPLFNTIFKANLTKHGDVVTLSSHFLSDPAAAAKLPAQQRAALITQPMVDAPRAVSLVAESLNDAVPADRVVPQGSADGAERM